MNTLLSKLPGIVSTIYCDTFINPQKECTFGNRQKQYSMRVPPLFMSLLNLGKSNNYSLVADYIQNPMVETMGEATISTNTESA